tara:strand:+ start:7530 stop:8153 length:624 start_codon:yes stop_codon:yes gene_type:complete
MIGIIDYGLSNLNSICNAILKLNQKIKLVDSKTNFEQFNKIILPGVGSFPKAIENLKKQKLFDIIKKQVLIDKKPILGICLGMQLFFEYSSEDIGSEGIGILKGKVKSLNVTKEFKVPNIGWRQIKVDQKGVLLKNIEENPIFYFIHKYACFSEEQNLIKSTLKHSHEFDCLIEKENIFCTQFHPEKSQKIGIKLLENFINYKNGKY